MAKGEEQLYQIDINLLQPNPLQPRGLIDKTLIAELAHSIKAQGILHPLVVAKTPAGYQIIAGERRWHAARLAGLDKVPVIIRETTARGMLEMSIVENLQREDLTPLERADAYQRLRNEFNLSVKEIADKVGKSQSFISNSMRLLELPDAVKDGLIAGFVSEGIARALLAIRDQKLMIEVYKKLLREDANTRRAEELARKYTYQKSLQMENRSKIRDVAVKDKNYIPIEKLRRLTNELAKVTGTRVEIRQSRLQAKIVFTYQATFSQTKPFIKKLFSAVTKGFNA